jgi:hypothetical protein
MPCGVPTRDSGLVNIGGVILVAVGMAPDDLEVDGGWYSVFLLVVSSSSSGFNNSEISTLAEGMVVDGLVTIICALLHGFNPREPLPGGKKSKKERIQQGCSVGGNKHHQRPQLPAPVHKTGQYRKYDILWFRFFTLLSRSFYSFLRPRSPVEKR